MMEEGAIVWCVRCAMCVVECLAISNPTKKFFICHLMDELSPIMTLSFRTGKKEENPWMIRMPFLTLRRI